MRKHFSEDKVRAIFSEIDYEDFLKLASDAQFENTGDITKEEATDKIREVCMRAIGFEKDEKPTKAQLQKALRRNRKALNEVLEDVIDTAIASGWDLDPFYNEFVEVKNNALGDTNEFYTDDQTVLTVEEVSGGHHRLLRQKLGNGSRFTVKTNWYGCKVYEDILRFLAGQCDWAKLVQKVYEAYNKNVTDMVASSVFTAAASVTPSTQFNITGELDADTLITLIEDVQAANNSDVILMGGKAALAQLDNLGRTNWISDNMRDEKYKTGVLGYFDGKRLVELKQRFAKNDTSTKLIPTNKILVLPVTDNKFIKLFNEGDIRVSENLDNQNVDDTMDFEIQGKFGVATVISKKFGMYTIQSDNG